MRWLIKEYSFGNFQKGLINFPGFIHWKVSITSKEGTSSNQSVHVDEQSEGDFLINCPS